MGFVIPVGVGVTPVVADDDVIIPSVAVADGVGVLIVSFSTLVVTNKTKQMMMSSYHLLL